MPLLVACGVSRAFAPTPGEVSTPAGTPEITRTATPVATITPTPTASLTPTPTARPRPTPTPKPKRVSEAARAVVPPRAVPQRTPVPGGTKLPVPQDTRVVWGGCASDGKCLRYNFYWAPTREAVLQHGEPPHKVQHELCHAHQHWTINRGAPLAPSDYDLESWYATWQGWSFVATVAKLPWPWSHSSVNGIEDFAWTCAFWYVDPAHLLKVSPERYRWAERHLP